MPKEVVVDTCVIVRANAPITVDEIRQSLFKKRIDLLRGIQRGGTVVVYSQKLRAEYDKHVKQPRNDFVKAFFAILDARGGIVNWSQWPRSCRDKARKCRFPRHDQHLLRTACGRIGSAIVTEERALVDTDAKVYQHFRVHVVHVSKC